MPWKPKDVDRFKKGLTEKQKRQWVEIANSVRAKCIADGGTAERCDALAVRQANGVVGNHMGTYQFEVNSYPIRTEMHQGKKHLVVPVIMLVEGVHVGSKGPLLHTQQEMGKYIETWNGIPVSIMHPERNGSYVSANYPDVIDSVVVGRVYNTKLEGGKLKGEVWLDEEKTKQVSPVAFAYIMQQRPLDVSVGVFTDDENVSGEWNGEVYKAVAHNYRPDHLALLPGGQGACSWKDGCGIRVNEKNKGGKSMKEKIDKLLTMAASVYTDTDREWLEKLEETQIDALLKCASIGVAANKRLEEMQMATNEKITALETEVNTLKKELEKGEKEESSKKVEVNEEMALKILEAQISDPAKFEKLLSPELKDQFQYGQKLYQEHRKSLVNHIMTNQATKVWTEEELLKKDSVDLEKIAKAIKAPTDYSGAGGENSSIVVQELLLPVGVNETKKEGK